MLTAKALEGAVHKEHEDEEYYSGECCGSDFKEYCREAYMWDEYDETPFESKEDYVAWVFEVPLSVAKGCLVVKD